MIFRRFTRKAVEILKRGGVGVLPTDTLYGISASVFSRKGIARIYRLRRRNPKKPFIVLISSLSDLKKLGVRLRPGDKIFLNKVWPGKVSVVLSCRRRSFFYLHRGAGTLAFRLPRHPKLLAFLRKTGPIVSTSVNPEGLPPARTIAQAKKYFGDKMDFYIDVGRLNSLPSTIVSLVGRKPKVLRRGVVVIE